MGMERMHQEFEGGPLQTVINPGLAGHPFYFSSRRELEANEKARAAMSHARRRGKAASAPPPPAPKRRRPGTKQAPLAHRYAGSQDMRHFGKLVAASPRNIKSIQSYLDTYPTLLDFRIVPIGDDYDPDDRASYDGAKKLSAFEYAIRIQDMALIKTIMASRAFKHINMPDEDGYTCLHRAIRLSNDALVHLFLRRGAVADRADARGDTPLVVVVKKAKGRARLRMLDDLLKSNIAVNKPDARGCTALGHAVAQRDLLGAEQLLEYGATNVADKAGHTPVYKALVEGHCEMVMLLQRFMPQIYEGEVFGPEERSPLGVATWLGDLQMMRMLLHKCPGWLDWAPLHPTPFPGAPPTSGA